MTDPTNIFSIDDLRLITGLDIRPYLSDFQTIKALIDKHYAKPVVPIKEKTAASTEAEKRTGKSGHGSKDQFSVSMKSSRR
jgi:type IV pilus assembly protein PilB